MGLIGFGTVGTGVLRLLRRNRRLIIDRLGMPLDMAKIVDKDLSRGRGVPVDKSILSRNPDDILDDPEIPIVIELMGGLEPARTFILKAVKKGKHVVTANKALLAEHGAEVFDAARASGVEIGFEASVAAGIPIVRAIREGLVGNRISSLHAIINGTSNYILTQMAEKGIDFGEALAIARKKGYAEADPTLDVDGIDAAHKLAILILLSFGQRIDVKDIHTEGIRRISPLDIEFAGEFGYRIKLLSIARDHDGAIEARVHPAMVPMHSQFAVVEGVFNAIHVSGDASGPLIFSGQGAGGMPAASAVVSDVVDIAGKVLSGMGKEAPRRSWKSGSTGPVRPGRVQPMGDIAGRYYLRFTAVDRPGVLARIARILGEHKISIAQVIQKSQAGAGGVPVVILTHEARERDLMSALKKTDRLSVVKARTSLLRIEDNVL